jgi:hypothetical protein
MHTPVACTPSVLLIFLGKDIVCGCVHVLIYVCPIRKSVTLNFYVTIIFVGGRAWAIQMVANNLIKSGLLRRILDTNKIVQEAACSAFATLEEVIYLYLNCFPTPRSL